MAGLIVVADPVAPVFAEALAGWQVRVALDPADLAGALPDAEGLVVRSRTRVTAELLEAAPRLRVIGRAGSGLDGVDLEAARRRGIAVVCAGAGAADAVAELTFGLMLALARDLPAAQAQARGGDWSKRVGSSLCGKRLGVLGLGRIGSRVATLGAAFGMRVAGLVRVQEVSDSPAASGGPPTWAAHLGATAAEPGLAEAYVDLDALLAATDVLTLHLPLTAETHHIVGARELALLPPGAWLINTARGGLVDEAALLAALDSGHLAGAALDVLETEPPSKDHPLLRHPRVLVTPHLGASTGAAQETIARELAAAMLAALAAR